MKYIVLSFDDGFCDFKHNALPLLEKYGFKATVGIITGFSDGSKNNNFDYMSIDDIKLLHSKGFDMAVHTDSHLKKTTIIDFEKSYAKLKEWIGLERVGAIIPYSQSLSKELLNYFLEEKYLYFMDYKGHKNKRNFRLSFLRLINKIHRTDLGNSFLRYHYYVYRRNQLGDPTPYLVRLPIKRENTPDKIISFIKKMSNKECLTIVFHSIVTNFADKVEYPDGAWSIQELDKLLSFLSTQKNVTVTTQRDLIYETK